MLIKRNYFTDTNNRIDDTKAYHFTEIKHLDEPVNSLTMIGITDAYGGSPETRQLIINKNDKKPLFVIGLFDFYDYKAFICEDNHFNTYEVYQYFGDDVWYITNSIDNYFEAIPIEVYL